MCSSFALDDAPLLPTFSTFCMCRGGVTSLYTCSPQEGFLESCSQPRFGTLWRTTVSLSPPDRAAVSVCVANAASALPSLRLCRACVRVCVRCFPVLAWPALLDRGGWLRGTSVVALAHAHPGHAHHAMRTPSLRAKCPPLLTAATVLSCSRFRSQPWPSKSPTFGWTSTAAMASPSHALPC